MPQRDRGGILEVERFYVDAIIGLFRKTRRGGAVICSCRL